MIGSGVAGLGLQSPHLLKIHDDNFMQSIMMGANKSSLVQQQSDSPYNAQYNNNFGSHDSFGSGSPINNNGVIQ